jgi:predicted transposase YbfD/YdcC
MTEKFLLPEFATICFNIGMQNNSALHSLQQTFGALPDPRRDHTKDHPLLDILMIAVCCLLCGGTGFVHMEQFGRAKLDWLRTFLDLPNGIPSHDTFRRVFGLLDPHQFATAFQSWTQSLRTAVGAEIVALDGKTVRRSFDRRKGQGPIHLVSAWASANRRVLGQLKTADKSNEITAVPELLRALELAGCLVTVDALNCQKNIAKEISEADADYALTLKANHGTAYEEVRSFLADARQRNFDGVAHDFVQTVDKEHGRFETRRCWITEQIGWFADRTQWEKLRSVALVESQREVNGERRVEQRVFLCSLGSNATLLAQAVRGHWGIENQLHWVLDVQLGEDDSRVRTGHAAENLATLRKIALNLLRRDTHTKLGTRAKQLKASWDHAYLQSLFKL